MKTIKAKIVKKTRNISEGTTPDSSVPAFDQMYYTFEIGENKFVDILCVTDYIEHNQYAYVMDTGSGSTVYGLIKAGEEQYYCDDVLPESQEKFLIDMVIEAYNKEFQYKPFS